MTEFGIQKLGNNVYVKNANGFEKTSYTQVGDTAIFKFEEKKPTSLYGMMGANFSKAAEPQGAKDEEPAAKADDAGKKDASVTVGNGNGTTIIIIGDNNHVNVGGEKDKVDRSEERRVG